MPSCFNNRQLEEASTHKSAKTHAGDVFVPMTSTSDLLTPK